MYARRRCYAKHIDSPRKTTELRESQLRKELMERTNGEQRIGHTYGVPRQPSTLPGLGGQRESS